MPRPPRYLAATALLALLLIMAGRAALPLFADFMAPRLERALGNRLNAVVRLEGFRIGPFDGVRVKRVTILPRSGARDHPAEIRLTGVGLELSFTHLLSGGYRITAFSARKLDARLDASRLKWMHAMAREAGFGGEIPQIRIQTGTVTMAHPALEPPLVAQQVSLLSGAGGKIYGYAELSFDNGKNRVRTNISLRPGTGTAQARLSVSDFSPASLPGAVLPGLGPAAGRTASFGNLSGEVTVRFSAASSTLLVTGGRLNARDASIDISSAGIVFGAGRPKRAWLEAETGNIDLQHLTRLYGTRFLHPDLRVQVRGGTLRAGIHARWTPEKGLDGQARITVRSGSVAVPALGGRLDRIHAKLDLLPSGRLFIRYLEGRAFGGRISVSGNMLWQKAGIREPRLEIALQGIAPPGSAVSLLPRRIGGAVEKINPENVVLSGKIGVAPGEIQMDLNLGAETLRVAGMPLELDNASCRIRWRSGSGQLVFENFRALLRDSPLAANGTLELTPSICADFTLSGTYLPVTPELLCWLELDPGPWEVSGYYDIRIRARNWRPGAQSLAGRLRGVRVNADFHNLSVARKDWGRLADGWSGRIFADASRIRFSDLGGTLLGVPFSGSGSIPITGQGGTHLQLASETVLLDKAFYRRLGLTGGSQRWLPGGQCEIRAEFRSGEKKRVPENAILTVLAHELEIRQDRLHARGRGRCRMEASWLDSGEIVLDGILDLDRFSFNRLEAERLSGRFHWQDRRLYIPEMEIHAYGGRVGISGFSIDTRNRKWRARISPANLEMESLAGTFGLSGRRAPAGSLSGKLELSGSGFNPQALAGGGEIRIANGRLYHFPLFASVFNVLDLQMPRQTPATDAYGVIRVEEGCFRLKDLLLLGGTVPMHMKGTITLEKGKPLKDQRIDLLVTAAKTGGILDRIPVINWVKHYTIDFFRRLAFQARVRGTIADHEVKRLSSPVTEPVEQMWSLMEKIAPSPPKK